MTLACQRDSYLKEIQTKVLSCDAEEDGKYYAVELEDTVLFPTGGGQPDDIGKINDYVVTGVKRKGQKVLHYVEEPLTVGETVTTSVNWERRFDHMQQHTGQHLITAVAEMLFGYTTSSWSLGDEISYIELCTPCLTTDEMHTLENVLNEKIRDCIPVTAHLYEKGSPELQQVRARLELPADHVGPVRVVNIEGIDSNTCCGTHVKNTSELQVIKLLFTEKGKRKKTNLYFIVGNRVLKSVGEFIERENTLHNLLGCAGEDIVISVKKMQKSLRLANRNALFALRELAVLEAKMFQLMEPKPKFFALHKKNALPEFMSVFLSEVGDKYDDVLIFLTVGDGITGGQLILTGPEKYVQEYGPKICTLLDGKGFGKKATYKGKFSRHSHIEKAEEILRAAVEE